MSDGLPEVGHGAQETRSTPSPGGHRFIGSGVRQTVQPPYRWCPVDWDSALELPYPFLVPKMHALTDAQSWEAEGGVWTDGSARTEFVLIRPPRYAKTALYLLTVETASGVRPSDIGLSNDRRWLGVFVKALS